MKLVFMILSFFAASALSQDVVQVICHQTEIVARIQKHLVKTAEYSMGDIHLNDRSCMFDEEEGDFFVRRISPITSCGTHHKTNATHVVFTNSVSTVNTGPTFPHGIVIGSQANRKVLSALISCTYRIDLNVSTMFVPNITIIPIQMPDAYESGEFQATMALFEDDTYETAFTGPPSINPEDSLHVGVRLLGDASPDVYLLVEKCWGTISASTDAFPKYSLIQNGCPVAESGDGLIRMFQNGVGHQAMWTSPVFKFVGDGEEFDNVWLHCDLQICINKACEPTCSSKLKKRSIGNGQVWGPDDFNTPHLISLGPIKRLKVTEIYENETRTSFIEVKENELKVLSTPEPETFWKPSTIAVIGGLGGLLLICVILSLIAIIVRAQNRQSMSGLSISGIPNKGYLIQVQHP